MLLWTEQNLLNMDVSMNRDQLREDAVTRLVFKCCEWLASADETQTDVDAVDQQSDSTFPIVNFEF